MNFRRSRVAWISLFVILGMVGVGGFSSWRRSQADPARVFTRAEADYRAGKFVDADQALDRLARLRAPTTMDHYLRAQVDLGLKRDQKALVELAAIPDDHPLAPLALLRTGQIEIRLRRTRPAEAAFLAALKLMPRAVQPRKELVYLYNIQHRQAELDEQLIALLELNQLDFQIVLHWTKTRNTNWKPAGDLPALCEFVAADSTDRFSRLALADALYRLNRLDEAEEILEAMSPTDPDARAKRVAIAIDVGDFTTAEALLAQAQSSSPELARLRGQLALKQGDGRAALREFQIALSADAFDRVALYGMGTALRLTGQSDLAQDYIESAGRHDLLWQLVARAATPAGESDPKIPHQLGMACLAAGRFHEARAWLKLAIERDPLDAEGQRTLFQLEHNEKPPAATRKRRPVSDTSCTRPHSHGVETIQDRRSS